jgi:hypothetical protein
MGVFGLYLYQTIGLEEFIESLEWNHLIERIILMGFSVPIVGAIVLGGGFSVLGFLIFMGHDFGLSWRDGKIPFYKQIVIICSTVVYGALLYKAGIWASLGK